VLDQTLLILARRASCIG